MKICRYVILGAIFLVSSLIAFSQTAPTATTATSITTTSFTANWSSVAGATSYFLDVSTANSFASFVSGYNSLSVTGTTRTITGLTTGTYYYYRLRSVSAGGTSANSNIISVLTTGAPPTPTSSVPSNVSATGFTANWGSLSGATSYRLDVSTSNTFSSFVSGYNNLTVSTNSQSVVGLAANTPYYYRVRAVNASGTSSNSSVITTSTTTVAPTATASTNVTTNSFVANWGSVAGAASYRLDVSTVSNFSTLLSGYNDLTVGTTTASVTNLTNKTTYYYRIRAVNASGSSANSNVIMAANLDMNYIRSIAINVAGKTTAGQVESSTVNEATTVYDFFDGLGRPIQNVIKQGSPLLNDIVQPIVYDTYGRESKKYLPFVYGTDGWYKQVAFDVTGNYAGVAGNTYGNNTAGKIADDTRPFSETIFEVSPLNRPLKDYGPGSSWGPLSGSNKFIERQYLINVHNIGASTTQEKVIAWKLDANGLPIREIPLTGFVEAGGYYSTGQLSIGVTVDEQGNSVREYKNRTGQIVLKRVQAAGGTTNLNSTTDWAMTYYLYDDFGNLRYVFQPELSKAIHNAADTYVVTATDLTNFAFQYKYDARKRMTEKRVPGSDWTYMVYDKRDRLVMTQDGNQRSPKQWSFTKYDILNRPVLTGIYTADSVLVQSKMQRRVNAYYATVPGNGGAWFESYTGGATTHGYDNKSYPQESNVDNYLTVTYYDNYNFRTNWLGTYTYLTDGLISGVYTQVVTGSESQRVVGQATGSKTKVLDGGTTGGYTWLKAISYYDDKYRVIQTQSDNYKGGIDRVSNVYDFTGKVLKTKATHVEQDVTWKDLVGVKQVGNKLIRTVVTTSWGDSGAASEQQLPAGQNGWIEFIATETNTYRMLGLSDQNTDANYTSIDYAWYPANAGVLYIFESGTSRGQFGTYSSGDVLKIDRTGTIVKYYKNNVLIYTSTVPSPTALMADATFNVLNSSIANTRASFSNTSKTITRRFEYDHGARLTHTWHSVGQSVTWTDVVGVAIGPNTVTKTSGSGWDAGSASIQQLGINQNGSVKIKVGPSNPANYGFMFGLSALNAGQSNTTIDYAIFLESGNLINVYEKGVFKGRFGSFAAGDELKVERVNGVITYSRNGAAPFYTSAVTTTAGLIVDTSFSNVGATMQDCEISFGEILLARNEYNEVGQLVDKKLHSTVAAATDNKQSVDYRYNIRGWLTSMNNAALTSDAAVTNDDATDLFGMTLSYNTIDTDLGNSQFYNGNISGMKWSNYAHVIGQKGYTYSYDAMNRLSGSVYKEKSSSWSTLANSRFAETGFTYDLNGNIKSLTRNDKRASGTMDILTYNYGSGATLSNRLLYVTDGGDAKTGFFDGNAGAVQDYTYDNNGNMTRDLNKGIGTSIGDATNLITYNYLNLPETVTKGGNTIRYIYDAAGRKLSQVVTFGASQKQTDYAGEFTYENDALQYISHEEGRVAMTSTRLIYANSFNTVSTDITAVGVAAATFTGTNAEKYVQVAPSNTTAGNGLFPIGATIPVIPGERFRVRAKGYGETNAVNLQVKTGALTLNATFPLTATNEAWVEQIFTIPVGATTLQVGAVWGATITLSEKFYINELEITKLAVITPEYQYNLKDHLGNVRLTFTTKQETDAATATLETANAGAERSKFVRYDNARKVSHFLFDHTNGVKPSTATGFAQRLSGKENEVYGLGRSLSVMPGDVINMEVYGKYIDSDTAQLRVGGILNLILQLAANPASTGIVTDGGAYGSSTTSFPFVADGTANTSRSTETGPKAYLSWLVYDRNYNLVLSKCGYDRLTTIAREYGQDAAHEKLMGTVTISEPGYVYIYVSNEEGANPYEVYFDDFKVDHVKSPVIQVDDYYPFGLTFNSYKRENSVENKIKLQGQEHTDDLDLGWDSFRWRNYMPSIGRFFNVDPLADKYVHNSTYAFAENKVVTFIELEGLEGLHYMEPFGNGQRHVIEKNVIVLTKSPRVIPAGASDRKIARINRQNVRIAQSNAAKVAEVANELTSHFNGSDGQAYNSAGEAVRFQFNVTGMEVQNTNTLGTTGQARAIAVANGLTGQPAFNGGPAQVAAAAIVTTQPTGQSSTDGVSIKVDETPGAIPHEVGHTLMTRGQSNEESRPGSGGLMVDPPSTITPNEVDKMQQDAIPR